VEFLAVMKTAGNKPATVNTVRNGAKLTLSLTP
jgi:hypothetical protein